MCDEAKLADWARQAISRRDFGALAGAATVAACAAGEARREVEDRPVLTETGVTFATADGTMDAFFVHPDDGRHPGVVFWPDIAALREAKRNMARRLAGEGYAVLVLNPYYRDAPGEQFADFAAFVDQGGFDKVGPWRDRLDAAAIGRDAAAAADWLDRQAAVDAGRGIGTQGYCMGGPFAIWSAAAVPSRIRAAASFHGGGLVRGDNPDSPHNMLDEVEARLLIAIAEDDHAKEPSAKLLFAKAAGVAAVPARIEVYEGDHGWTVPDSPAYAEAAAEKAYEDLLALYEAAL
ncbi:dienelactone hydrolase family protein [Erythrobacter sp. HL-111]|uniref:dienelactone hydrolase family protein n=1 Tax=Erythrobacter sp. HL-111 TaxID=1798193 RepID=UPI0006DAA669|nr:dienelactone hydrolase family protein [Erythrobacter sp. HL-111]KPP94438.1 MAG: carboxymethylenebutenolidase [Erythrobacteraceae bacterium HL-111]SDS56921.1 carboxymethylenebutenolidase [Erythrobacter sp. HL-111]